MKRSKAKENEKQSRILSGIKNLNPFSKKQPQNENRRYGGRRQMRLQKRYHSESRKPDRYDKSGDICDHHTRGYGYDRALPQARLRNRDKHYGDFKGKDRGYPSVA